MRKKDTSISVKGIYKGAVENAVSQLNTCGNGEAIVASGSGNLPRWAGDDGLHFWRSVDSLERYHGPACQGITLTLPQGISPEERVALVQRFAKEEIGSKPYAFSIRETEGQPDRALVVMSGRVQDGIIRDEEQFFRRFRNALPAFSGCRKDGQGKVRGELSDPELTLAQNWNRLSAQAVARAKEADQPKYSRSRKKI